MKIWQALAKPLRGCEVAGAGLRRFWRRHTVKSWEVCNSDSRFEILVGYRYYQLGVRVHPWGVRFLLVWWHLCFHWEKS